MIVDFAAVLFSITVVKEVKAASSLFIVAPIVDFLEEISSIAASIISMY